MCYIPHYFIPILLTGEYFPREAWAVLHKRAKMIRIVDSCAPLWVWLHVRILGVRYYLQGLDYLFSTLPVLPKDPELLQ